MAAAEGKVMEKKKKVDSLGARIADVTKRHSFLENLTRLEIRRLYWSAGSWEAKLDRVTGITPEERILLAPLWTRQLVRSPATFGSLRAFLQRSLEDQLPITEDLDKTTFETILTHPIGSIKCPADLLRRYKTIKDDSATSVIQQINEQGRWLILPESIHEKHVRQGIHVATNKCWIVKLNRPRHPSAAIEAERWQKVFSLLSLSLSLSLFFLLPSFRWWLPLQKLREVVLSVLRRRTKWTLSSGSSGGTNRHDLWFFLR